MDAETGIWVVEITEDLITQEKIMENYKLPKKLHQLIERELTSNETIQWIEQPISRFFTRSTVSVCLALLVPLIFFSLTSLTVYRQAVELEISLFEFVGLISILIFVIGIIIPLILIFLIPISHWQEARQTVYVITNKRAFILVAAWSVIVTSFVSSELRVISRRENKDGSGDVIVYIHRSIDNEGNVKTQEVGFKHVHHAREFERMLRQVNFG